MFTFKKARAIEFGVRLNQENDVLHIRCLLNEKYREPEALKRLDSIGGFVKSLPTGFYTFVFTPVANGLFWNYEWARLEEEPPQP